MGIGGEDSSDEQFFLEITRYSPSQLRSAKRCRLYEAGMSTEYDSGQSKCVGVRIHTKTRRKAVREVMR
jgi:hypothetical protein